MKKYRLTVIPAMGGFRSDHQPAPIANGSTPHDPLAAARVDRLQVARGWVRAGGSVVLCGPAGRDMEAALAETIAAAGQVRVLRVVARQADRRRPLCGLTHLLSSVTRTELDALPAAQGKALTAAVTAPRNVDGFRPTAFVGRALLSLLEAFTINEALVLAVANAQWLDPDTTNVLRFAASRVGGRPVQVVVTEESTASRPPVGHRLCPPPLLVVWLAAVSQSAAPVRILRLGGSRPGERHS